MKVLSIIEQGTLKNGITILEVDIKDNRGDRTIIALKKDGIVFEAQDFYYSNGKYYTSCICDLDILIKINNGDIDAA